MEHILSKAPIQVSVSEGVFFFRPSEIVRLEASSSYTYIHFINRQPMLVAKVLKQFDAELGRFGFVRTHRKHLVNREYINAMDTSSGSIMVNNTSKICVARKRKTLLKRLLAA